MMQSSDVAHRDQGLLPDDFVVHRNATATKSWFLLDEEIVVLAAGVGDSAGRAVTTTLDARTAAPDDQVSVTGMLRDGRPWTGAGIGDLHWLRYANATQRTAVGYVFLDTPRVRVALDKVTRSRRAVRTSNPDTAVTRTVLGVTVDQAPGSEPTRLAYVLVPNAGEARPAYLPARTAEGPGEHLPPAGRHPHRPRPDGCQQLHARPPRGRRDVRRGARLGDRAARTPRPDHRRRVRPDHAPGHGQCPDPRPVAA